MKKFLSIVLMLTLAVCIVACGNKENNEENSNKDNLVGVSGDIDNKPIRKYFAEADLDKFASVQIIKLPEDTSTGYEWIYTIDDASIIEFVKDEFVLSNGLNPVDRGSGERVCEIKGLAEGETIISFKCINPSAVENELLESVKFYVKVNADNEIAITDEIH